MGGSGLITFDVLDWLNDQDVPIIRLSAASTAVHAIGGYGFAADHQKPPAT